MASDLSCVHVTVPNRGGVYLFVRDGKVVNAVGSGTGVAVIPKLVVGMPIAEAKALAAVGLKKRKR